MMFNLLGSVVKAAGAVIDIPVAIVADAVTLKGAMSDRETTYTGDAMSRFVQNVSNITDPEK